MPTLPIIHSRQEADAGGYRRETIDLEFSNGERRKYERLSSRGHGAVMIAAIPEPGTVLLIREYAAGVHRYELGLPKGRMDAGEGMLDAANRELKEETGFGARKLTHLRALTPGARLHDSRDPTDPCRGSLPRAPSRRRARGTRGGAVEARLRCMNWCCARIVRRAARWPACSSFAKCCARDDDRMGRAGIAAGARGRRGDHACLRAGLRGRAQGRPFAADRGGHGRAPSDRRRPGQADSRHPGPVGRVGRTWTGPCDGHGSATGWSIRSTAPANSSRGTASSPSTSR